MMKPKVYRDLMEAICPHGFTVPWRFIKGAPTPECERHGWTERTASHWAAREITARQFATHPTITVTTHGTTDPAALPHNLAPPPCDVTEPAGGPRVPGWGRSAA